MLTKNELKYYSSLLLKKFRKREQKFLAEGKKLISEALNFNYECEIIFITSSFSDENREFVKSNIRKKIRTEILKHSELDKLSDTKTSQEIVAVFRMKEEFAFSQFNDPLIVALENISDPGNMGTILRNCDWFGVKSILLSFNCAEIYNPKVIRSSAGSVFHLNISEEKNFYQMLTKKKKEGFNILCADIEGKNLYALSKKDKIIVVLSNEANGPTNSLLEICDSKITVPRLGNAESLNVANASAVILSELTKK